MSDLRLPPHEHSALMVLGRAYPTEANLRFFRGVAKESGTEEGEAVLTEKQAKRAVRRLARKGFAELSPAYDLDFRICGSGYGATPEGYRLFKELSND